MKEILKHYVNLFKELDSILKVNSVSANQYSITLDAGARGRCGLVVNTNDTTFVTDYLNRKLKALKGE